MNSTEMTTTDLFQNEGNTLLIFGNGLDLDLGYDTSYEDYFLSNHFPFVNNDQSCHSLGHFVYDMIPWYYCGNSEDDTTTKIDRIFMRKVRVW